MYRIGLVVLGILIFGIAAKDLYENGPHILQLFAFGYVGMLIIFGLVKPSP